MAVEQSSNKLVSKNGACTAAYFFKSKRLVVVADSVNFEDVMYAISDLRDAVNRLAANSIVIEGD